MVAESRPCPGRSRWWRLTENVRSVVVSPGGTRSRQGRRPQVRCPGHCAPVIVTRYGVLGVSPVRAIEGSLVDLTTPAAVTSYEVAPLAGFQVRAEAVVAEVRDGDPGDSGRRRRGRHHHGRRGHGLRTEVGRCGKAGRALAPGPSGVDGTGPAQSGWRRLASRRGRRTCWTPAGAMACPSGVTTSQPETGAYGSPAAGVHVTDALEVWISDTVTHGSCRGASPARVVDDALPCRRASR